MENKKRILSASIWVLAGYFSSQVLRLGSNLVLTRLLVPEMFGVMAIVTAINVGMTLCTEMGLRQNTIRHIKGAEPEYLNTAWTMQIIRGALVWLLIFAVGCWLKWLGGSENADNVYAYPELPLILWVSGANALISGFASTKVWLAQRNMQLARVTLIELFSQIIGIVVMVAWAYFQKSIWGLVYGNLISTFLNVALTHIVLSGKGNKLCLNRAIAAEFFHFGKWLFLSAVITFFAIHGDRLLLGGLLTPEKLGVYTVAYFLAESINFVSGKFGDSVFFPLLSSAWRENPSAIKAAYYKIRLIQDATVMMVAGCLYDTAPFLINFLYEQRYQDAAWMLKILSISLIFSVYTLGSKLLTITGRPYVRTIIVSARAVVLWLTVPLAFQFYGLEGAIYAIAGNGAVEFLIIVTALHKYHLLSFFREIMLLPLVVLGYGLGEACKLLYNLIPKEFFLWLVQQGQFLISSLLAQ